jgi:uncharacterized membrane protein SpoIIM required for sporulation
MKASEILAERQQNWAELQRLCAELESKRKRRLGPEVMARFAALYRAACADLALADAYHLPPGTVQYLHQLVARAHNQLYRSRRFAAGTWFREMVYRVPQRLFQDRFLWLSFALFFGFGIASYFMARFSPTFAEQAITPEKIQELNSWAHVQFGRSFREDAEMAGFYVMNNAGIGLQCFALGLLLGGFGGMFAVIFNACHLGAVFGYMDTTSMSANFNNFVTAHAPFELTAIVLSGAAGMRLGFSYIYTKGMSRSASLQQAGRDSLPVIMAAIVLFVLAAGVEGFISPSNLPYAVKASVSVICGLLLLFYFLLLGMPTSRQEPPREDRFTWDAAVREE